MNKIKVIIAFLVVMGIVFSACTGSAKHFIPAVVESGGGLVEIKVETTPGDGDVFITTYPHTGISTQESINNAVYYAASKTGIGEDCDILASIDGNTAEYVDGPSAGVAFSVLSYAAFTNKQVRNDATVTGAVDTDGVVGRVGGLYEKSLAAARNDIRYFLTPPQSVHERILLSQIKKTYELEIFEIENADDAIDFMVFNKPLTQKEFPLVDTELTDLEIREIKGVERFKDVTLDLIELERKTVDTIPEDETDIKNIKNLFVDELERQETLVEKGYLFTGANEAFLNYIGASTAANAANPATVNLDKKVEGIRNCINSVPEIKKTDANLEWVMGSDLRKTWAQQRLETTDITNAKLAEEKYVIYNQLMYADAWCFISHSLINRSVGENGKVLDEQSLKLVTQKKLLELEKLNISDSEWVEHYQSAQMLFTDGKYGAAAMDAAFAISMTKTDEELEKNPVALIESEILRLKSEERTSIWGKIYQSQGVFLESTDDKISAYRLLKLSEALDKVVVELREASVFTEIQEPAKTLPQRTVEKISKIATSERVNPDKVQCLPGFIFAFITVALIVKR